MPESAMRESAMTPLGCCGRGGGRGCGDMRGRCRKRTRVAGRGRAWEEVVKVVAVAAVVVMLVSPVEAKTNRSTLGEYG